jgi:hypothetical protein
MTSTRRPIRLDERETFERWTEPAKPDKRDAILPALVAVVVIWAVLPFVSPISLPERAAIGVPVLIALLVLTYWLAFRLYIALAWRPLRKQNEQIAAERLKYQAITEVEEWHVRVVNAIEVYLDEDVGSQFYLELEDGQVLVLGEEWLRRTDDDQDSDDAPWAPNRELLITRLLPPRRRLLDVKCLGEFFAPAYTRDATAEYGAGTIEDDGAVLPGPLSRYMQSPVPKKARA